VVEINKLLARIGASVAVQRRFVADRARLRSPMTAMTLQAERLGAADMPNEARGRLQAVISGGAPRAARPAADLARRPGAGQLRKVSLAAVIRQVLEDLVRWPGKNIDWA
jgi:two-component system OmpR family sensor kinase